MQRGAKRLDAVRAEEDDAGAVLSRWVIDHGRTLQERTMGRVRAIDAAATWPRPAYAGAAAATPTSARTSSTTRSAASATGSQNSSPKVSMSSASMAKTTTSSGMS